MLYLNDEQVNAMMNYQCIQSNIIERHCEVVRTGGQISQSTYMILIEKCITLLSYAMAHRHSLDTNSRVTKALMAVITQ